MHKTALFIGSIGVLCETSNMQRHAYNTAFKEIGLDWLWEAKAYTRLVQADADPISRIEAYARSKGDRVDPDAVETRKSRIFRQMLEKAPVRLRPGLADTLIAVRRLGLSCALTTSDDVAEIEALVDAATPRLSLSDFAFIGHRDMAHDPKPAPDIYTRALRRLSLDKDNVLAVEDTPEGAEAARLAGIDCVSFPNAAQLGRDFGAVLGTVDVMSPSRIGLGQGEGFSMSA